MFMGLNIPGVNTGCDTGSLTSASYNASTSVSVEQLLKHGYVKSETIDYACENVRCTSRVSEMNSQWSGFPELLLIVLKRYDSMHQKLSTEVHVDQGLHIGEGSKSVYYNLSAIICHFGPSSLSGHYNTLVRTDDGWLCFDDEKVSDSTDIDFEQVNKNAYVLAYTKSKMDMIESKECKNEATFVPSTACIAESGVEVEYHEQRLRQSPMCERRREVLHYLRSTESRNFITSVYLGKTPSVFMDDFRNMECWPLGKRIAYKRRGKLPYDNQAVHQYTEALDLICDMIAPVEGLTKFVRCECNSLSQEGSS